MTGEVWTLVARRCVDGLGVRTREQVLIRDGTGNIDLLLECMLAIERVGATPRVELIPASYVERLLAGTPAEYLARWDRHRFADVGVTDRVLRLQGADPRLEGMEAGLGAWSGATQRLTAAEERRQRPFLLVVAPDAERARQPQLPAKRFEEILIPAITVPVKDLWAEIEPVLGRVRGAGGLSILTGHGLRLDLRLRNREWLVDDGVIDEEDRARGAVVSNLPAGSIYTTVLETSAEGSLSIPRAVGDSDAVLHFSGGRIVSIEAGEDTVRMNALFDRHSGEPRRVSHVGIGLNPLLREAIGDTVVDEHVHGSLFIAFGENRYMGGENESTLNVDFTLPGASLLADRVPVVRDGAVVV